MRPTRIFVRTALCLVLLCLLSLVAEAQTLAYGRLLQVMGCLSQKDAPVHLDSDYSDTQSFRVRLLYGVRDTVDKTESDLLLIVYGKDRKSALLFLIAIDRPDLGGKMLFRDAASVEKMRDHWDVGELYNGGFATHRWLQRLVDRTSGTSLRVIPRSEVRAATAACWWKATSPTNR